MILKQGLAGPRGIAPEWVNIQKWDTSNPLVNDHVPRSLLWEFPCGGNAPFLSMCQTHLLENDSKRLCMSLHIRLITTWMCSIFFSRTLAWFVPLKLCFVQVLTAIVSGSNASDIHQFRSWLLLLSRIQGYLRFVYVCKVGLSRNRLICKLKWIAQNGLYQTLLVFPSLTFCLDLPASVPRCMTGAFHIAVWSSRLSGILHQRFPRKNWSKAIHFSTLAHLGSTTRQRFMNSGQVDHGQQTKTAQNYGRSEGVDILHTGIYIICASMSILLSKQVPSFATQSTIPLSESRKVQRRHMLFSVYLWVQALKRDTLNEYSMWSWHRHPHQPCFASLHKFLLLSFCIAQALARLPWTRMDRACLKIGEP